MNQKIKNLISYLQFLYKSRLWGRDKYAKFINHVDAGIAKVIDKEIHLLSLSIQRRWCDRGGNTHILLKGEISRRNEKSSIGAELVWLKKLNIFRGNCWSGLRKKSDTELLLEAKYLFYSHQYTEFLTLANHIQKSYLSNPIFNKMCLIAKRRIE